MDNEINNMIVLRLCTKCLTGKKLKDFDINRNGYDQRCKECKKEYNKRLYNKNKKIKPEIYYKPTGKPIGRPKKEDGENIENK